MSSCLNHQVSGGASQRHSRPVSGSEYRCLANQRLTSEAGQWEAGQQTSNSRLRLEQNTEETRSDQILAQWPESRDAKIYRVNIWNESCDDGGFGDKCECALGVTCHDTTLREIYRVEWGGRLKYLDVLVSELSFVIRLKETDGHNSSISFGLC